MPFRDGMLLALAGAPMHSIARVWMLLLPLTGVGAFLAASAPAAQEVMPQQLDGIFAGSVHPGEPGLAVLVKRDGRIVFEKGYGVRKIGSDQAIAPNTNFRLASFTKQFTAMAIMLLIHDGKLRYETKLTEIFPAFPAYGKEITVRNLLTHTAGLPDYEDLMDKEEKAHGTRWTPEHQIQDEEVLALLEKERAGKFAPGASWAYSNSGYVVLGLVVVKVSGLSYADFLQQRIFAPLGMKDTVVYQKGKNEIRNRAFGHSLENGKLVETDQSATSATLGDGGVYSNLEDLSRWDDALANHTLLSAQEMQPALTPVKLADGREPHWPAKPDDDNLAPGQPVSYGFGWFLNPWRGHARMWHSGSTIGFRTVIDRFSTDHLTIVILCNRADLDPTKLALLAADFYWETPK
jgi:CubicO group peptidase (beta-lactamase class C family)